MVFAYQDRFLSAGRICPQRYPRHSETGPACNVSAMKNICGNFEAIARNHSLEVRLAQLMCADDRRLQPGDSFAVCVCSAEHLPDGPSEPTHRGDPYMRRRKALQHTAGRAAASLALQQLGSATGEIAPGAQGEPIW